MGKSLLIMVMGFAASFGIVAYGRNRRVVESVDRMVERFSDYGANNASTSGAFMALNQLYLNPAWRAGYEAFAFGGQTITIGVQDANDDASLGPSRIRISVTGQNGTSTVLTEVEIFDSAFHDFAVWAKDSVTNVITTDSTGLPDVLGKLLMENAPYMPEVDNDGLVTEATGQGHVESGGTFVPADGYPNGNFYYFGSMPNVTHVEGDLRIQHDRTIFGIFVVEGNVILEADAKVNGILYLPNSSSAVTYGGNGYEVSRIRGGILTWGTVDGSGSYIVVRHDPSYLNEMVSNFASDNSPIRVLSWTSKELDDNNNGNTDDGDDDDDHHHHHH